MNTHSARQAQNYLRHKIGLTRLVTVLGDQKCAVAVGFYNFRQKTQNSRFGDKRSGFLVINRFVVLTVFLTRLLTGLTLILSTQQTKTVKT